MHPLKKIAVSPTPYLVWAALVTAALLGTYNADPYIFGFTTLGLGAITAFVAVVGLGASLLSRTSCPGARALNIAGLVIAGAAVALAFAALRTFKWA